LKKYDGYTAKILIDIVHQNELDGIGYRDLQRRSGLVNHNKKFDLLIKRLRECKVFASPTLKQPGHKVPVRLTEEASKKLKERKPLLAPDLFTLNQTPLTVRSHRFTHRERIIMAIVVQAAFDTVTERRTSKPRRGDVMMEDPLDSNRKICFTTSYPKPGTGIDDIITKHIRPGRNARMLDNRHNTSLDELFSHCLTLSQTEAKEILESLVNNEAPILKKIRYENEDRFEIADPILRQFVIWWVLSIFEVKRRMEYCYHSGKLNGEQKSEFKKWIKLLFGTNTKTWEIISNLNFKNNPHLDKGTTTNLKVNLLDMNILAYQEILRGNFKDNPETYAHRNIQRIYPEVVKPMLNLRYPPFLGTRLEELKNKQKHSAINSSIDS